jgi:hypothetical protein
MENLNIFVSDAQNAAVNAVLEDIRQFAQAAKVDLVKDAGSQTWFEVDFEGIKIAPKMAPQVGNPSPTST